MSVCASGQTHGCKHMWHVSTCIDWMSINNYVSEQLELRQTANNHMIVSNCVKEYEMLVCWWQMVHESDSAALSQHLSSLFSNTHSHTLLLVHMHQMQRSLPSKWDKRDQLQSGRINSILSSQSTSSTHTHTNQQVAMWVESVFLFCFFRAPHTLTAVGIMLKGRAGDEERWRSSEKRGGGGQDDDKSMNRANGRGSVCSNYPRRRNAIKSFWLDSHQAPVSVPSLPFHFFFLFSPVDWVKSPFTTFTFLLIWAALCLTEIAIH